MTAASSSHKYIHAQASCPWPMLDRIRMAPSSSYALSRLHGLTVRISIPVVMLFIQRGETRRHHKYCFDHTGKHVVFGSVTKGMDVVKKVA